MNYRFLIFSFLITVLTLYLGTGLFLYSYLILVGIHFRQIPDKTAPLLMFFIITYLAPYELNASVLGYKKLGNFIDNLFLAGVPIYLSFFSGQLRWGKFPPKLRLVLLTLMGSLLLSTLIPGIVNLLSIGGTRVRFSLVVNYINAFLIAVIGYKTLGAEKKLMNLFHLLIILGFIAALGGLVQYFFKFYFFDPKYAYPNVERLSIIAYPDPVDLFPFFIVPLAIGMNYLLSTLRKKGIVVILSVVTICFASFFTFSRWGWFSVAVVILSSLLINRRVAKLIGVCLVVLIVFLFVPTMLMVSIFPADQVERLASENTLLTRVHLWGMGLTALQNNWISGVGLGNTARAAYGQISQVALFDSYDPFFNYDFVQSLHSFFLDWVLSMGVFVVPGITLLYYFTLKNCLAVLRKSSNRVSVFCSKSIILSLIGLTVFWLQNFGSAYYWLFLFVSLSFHLLERSKADLNSVITIPARVVSGSKRVIIRG
jgi:hypothetical protein